MSSPTAIQHRCSSPAPKLSGRERAYRYVRDEVLRYPESTGTFLNEQALGTLLGISRTPVREALLQLQAEGFVEAIPKRGVYVAPIERTPRHRRCPHQRRRDTGAQRNPDAPRLHPTHILARLTTKRTIPCGTNPAAKPVRPKRR
ncbi:GntR family transcriptional regulator (plasmid) [Rhodococcus pseudokoreensis]|uniref:GntR family transcriptional regulator n=1 Tax=Rhodococcus pseudokoreensis TaxID=2811421 RepID=A0A974VZ35_9NOCA|nr:GntR family transcriptional regulator [Rhodococcus pseudokoreensis]